MRDSYKTPEGFSLHRPLVFPDVTDFTELLTVEGRWDFATMNHRNGRRQEATPDPIRREGWDRTIERFCSTRQIPGRDYVSLFVTPTEMLVERIYAVDDQGYETNEFAFLTRVSFQAIYHPSNDRVLVLASDSSIISSRYLAYVPLETLPIPD